MPLFPPSTSVLLQDEGFGSYLPHAFAPSLVPSSFELEEMPDLPSSACVPVIL